LAPAIMDLVEQLTPLIDQATPVLLELFQSLLPVIAEIAGTLPAFLEALIPIIPAMGDLALLVLTLIDTLLPPFTELMTNLQPVITDLTGFLAENGEVMGALITAFALFTIGVRIATGALGLFAGGAATATGASSGLFGILARHPFVAVVTAILAGATALTVFRKDIAQTSEAGRLFMEGMARVAFGTSLAFHKMAELIVKSVQGALNIVVDSINAVAKRGGETFGIKAIELPRFEFTTPQPMDLEGWREFVGLANIYSGMEFPEVDTTGITDQLDRRNRDVIASQTRALGMLQPNLNIAPGLGAGLFAPGTQPGFYDYGGMTGFRSAGPTQQNTYNINVNAGLGVNGQRVGDDVLSIITRYEEEAGPIFQRVRYTGG